MPGLPSISGLTQSEPSAFDEACDCFPTLTYKQRVISFVVCLIFGWVVSLLGSIAFWSGNITLFAVLYVIGSCISIASTAFLIGPLRQCKKMFHETRRIACIVYLALLIATFLAGILQGPFILVLFLLIAQGFAAAWYMISYIPYGRTFVKNTCCGPCKGMCGDEEEG